MRQRLTKDEVRKILTPRPSSNSSFYSIKMLVNEVVPNGTASGAKVAIEHTEMLKTLIDVVLPVVMESHLERTLHILCVMRRLNSRLLVGSGQVPSVQG
ncbi:hypothetical protein RYX36_023012 [Vicia faba]